jgi:cysteine desulfurase/selenocysteine lyase
MHNQHNTLLHRRLTGTLTHTHTSTHCSTAYTKFLHGVSLSPGDQLISVGESEYAANAIAMLLHAKRHNASVIFVPGNPEGGIDLARLQQVLADAPTDKVKVVSLTHIPTNGGEST